MNNGEPRFSDLTDASVCITGGGSGIGAALTEAFLLQGANVAFIDIDEQVSATLADKLEKSTGRRPLYLKADITDIEVLRSAIGQAATMHGPITVLVNNAANDKRHTAEEVTEEFWDWSQAINLKAYFFAAQAVIPGMKAAGGGAIINFSSISYMLGNSGYPSYSAANAGITGLTRSLAREFGPARIRVNAIMPGWVLTKKQLELWADPRALAAHLDRQCLKEHLVEKDIVGGALFLASSASRMMTGQALVIDGGVVVTG